MLPFISAQEALQTVKSGNRVFVHGMGAFPTTLVQALVDRKEELSDVEIVHLHTEGPAEYAKPGMEQSFFTNCLFVGPNMRVPVEEGRADYVPTFLSEIPNLFRKRALPLDVALVHVSPPDAHGYCSLGVSVDVALAAVQSATTVIAQVNPKMPRTHGDGNLRVSTFDYLVESQDDLPNHPPAPLSDIEVRIGRLVAELVEDGATLQMGIGGIPNAVLAALTDHKDLGIHTEMFSDGVVELVEKGVITGARKELNPGRIVSGFASGSKRLYDFIDDNPMVMLRDISYVNDTALIRKHKRMTAINSAVEIDLTGQICADSIGPRIISGVGGQMDFVRGASLSEGGKPIFALPSTTKRGESRIVPFLKEGAGVVTTRAHVHFVATEYGVVDLYGKNLRQRATALIQLAHPSHREALERAACERFHRCPA